MGSSHLGLPVHLGLAEDLGGWLELHAVVEEDGADDNSVRAHNFLVVCTVLAFHGFLSKEHSGAGVSTYGRHARCSWDSNCFDVSMSRSSRNRQFD